MRKRTERTIETDIFGIQVAEKPINSKKKGDSNERRVARWLEIWTGKPFTRVPRSGGLRWQGTANVCGDLVCEDDKFDMPFTIETKHLHRIAMKGRLRSNSYVYSIYEQCRLDCERSGRRPMLILRQNGMKAGTWVLFFEEQEAQFVLQQGISPYAIGTTPDDVRLLGFKSEEIININFVMFKNFVTFAKNNNDGQK